MRLYVMGERGARLENPTTDDIAHMRRIATEAMRAGAIGFSTSRTKLHRTAKGNPTPSLRAIEAELTGIALGLADAGTGVIELVSDFDTPSLQSEFDMIERIVQTSGRPLSLSLLQLHRAPTAWRETLDRIEASSRAGLPIRAQVSPRPIALLLGLLGSLNPFCTRPSFLAIQQRPLAEKLAIMRDPEFRRRLLAESPQPTDLTRHIDSFHLVYPLGDPPNYEPSAEDSIARRAAARNMSPADLAYDMLLENDGKNFLFMPFANYLHGNLDDCQSWIAHPDCLIGLGDGGAHVGFICDASFSTYLLTHWGRDRARGRFDIGWLVKRQTADNANAMGLHDRGVIAPGMKADLNVIDFDRLSLAAPTMNYDLPAGGKRLLQRATGYAATIVSGQVTYREGNATAALPGKLVRGPQVPA